MAGNVWEWVADRYGMHYYAVSPAANPLGPIHAGYRVNRGGGFDSFTYGLRVSRRAGDAPSDFYDTLGFRCARSCP